MTDLSSPQWPQRYEDLRAHTLGSQATLHPQAWAWVVFAQQGMRGWMRAWQDPLRPAGQRAQPAPTLNPSLNTSPQATVLLANRTLRCLGLSL